jgi:hypothetical protein
MGDLNQTFSNSSIRNSSFTGSTCSSKAGSLAERDGKIAGYSLILLISLLGNSLVILVVYKNKNMRKTINFFIVNMAASDLIIPLLVMPLQISRAVYGHWTVSGLAGEILCKIVFFLSEIPGLVSVLSLICMAIDRFVGVVFPLRAGYISSRVRVTMIIITWVISLSFSCTSFYAMQVIVGRDGNLYCIMRWHDDIEKHTAIHRAYFTVMSVVFFITPLILLVLLYSIILITLGKRKFPRVNQSQEAKKRNRRVSRSATVIAFTIVMVFWICWCPYNTITFLWAFKWDWKFPKFCGFSTIFNISQFLTWSNAAVNPCIYFVLIENYRKGLRTVLPRRLSASLNSSLRVGGRSTARQDTQVNDVGDCLELVDQ